MPKMHTIQGEKKKKKGNQEATNKVTNTVMFYNTQPNRPC